MNCRERGCVFPEVSKGYCAQHQWKLSPLADVPIGELPRNSPFLKARLASDAPKHEYKDQGELNTHPPKNPRWVWLEDALKEMPEGKVLFVEVPVGVEIVHMQALIRSALSGAHRTRDWKFAVRQTVDKKGLEVSKLEMWPESRERLARESQRANAGKRQPVETAEESVNKNEGSES